MDLKQANQLAREMVEKYGMGESLRVFSKEDGYGNTYSELTYTSADKEALELVNQAYKDAVALITENKSKMDVATDVLIKTIIMDSKQFLCILDNCDDTCVL